MKHLLLIWVITLLSCKSDNVDSLSFLLFTPTGYSDSRSAFFIVYDDEKNIKGLIGPGGKRALQNKSLLSELKTIVEKIEKKESEHLKYSVTVGRTGQRVRYLLTEEWLPVLSKIEENCKNDQLNAIRKMIKITKQSKKNGFPVIEK